MKKYTEQFKLSVVNQYLTGEAGYTTVAQLRQIPRSLVRRWVTFFKAHGIEGLRRKSGSYDAQFRLAVLEHMWENTLSYGDASVAFNIRDQCAVGIWERAYLADGIDALVPRPKRKPKKMSDQKELEPPLPIADKDRTRDELIVELRHLRLEVACLKKLEALDQAKRVALRKKRK